MADYPLGCQSAYNRLFDPKCPSVGYLALHQHFSSWWNYPDYNMIEFDIQDFEMRKVIYAITVDAQMRDTWAYTTHAPTAVLLDAMRGLYEHSLDYLQEHSPFSAPYPQNLGQAQTMRFEVQTYAPAVRAACMTNWTITISDESLKSPIFMPFPVQDQAGLIRRVSKDGQHSPTQYDSIDVDTKETLQQYLLNRSIVVYQNNSLIISDRLPHVLVIPTALPVESFTEIGLIILEPTNETNIWEASSCAIDSRWASASSIIESRDGDNMLQHEYTWDRVRNRVSTELNTPLTTTDALNPNDAFPRTIRVDPSWYELLSPIVSDADIYGTGYEGLEVDRSTLERLLEIIIFPSRGQWGGPSSDEPQGFGTFTAVRTMEHLISSVFADGLSRCGTHLHRQASKLLAGWQFGDWGINNETIARSFVHVGGPAEIFGIPPELTEFNSARKEMAVTFTGYVMTLQDGFDYFCVVLLLLHAAIALGYTFWVLWRQEIIEAWDTIPEILALAQTSPPPKDGILANTCAGIRSFRTMGKIATIEKSHETKGTGETEELLFRFRDAHEPRNEKSIIETGLKYGSIIG